MTASRRAAAVSLAVSCLLATPAVAAAPVTPTGKYQGTTSQNRPAIFGVLHKKVAGGAVVTAKCDRLSPQMISVGINPGVKLKGRSFSKSGTSQRTSNGGLVVTTTSIKGTFNRKATKVTGTVSGTVKLTQSVPGSAPLVVKCASGKVSFSAKPKK